MKRTHMISMRVLLLRTTRMAMHMIVDVIVATAAIVATIREVVTADVVATTGVGDCTKGNAEEHRCR